MKIKNPTIIKKVQEETLKLIASKGCRGWNMDELAKNSNMSKDTLYRLIGTKEKWLAKVFMNQMSENKKIIIEIIDNKDENEKKIELIFNSITEFISKMNSENMLSIMNDYPQIFKDLSIAKIEIDDLIIQYIDKLIECRYITNKYDARFIYEVVNAEIFHFIRLESDNSCNENIKNALNIIKRGLQNE